jgi:NCS1 family nucleobase:cation symporter-1
MGGSFSGLGPHVPDADHEELRRLDPDGRLFNPDLAPATPGQRRWKSYDLFAFWSNTAHNLGAYTFAAGLFALGLNAWQVTLGILGGAVVVFLGCLLSGAMGHGTGVPFPVISRLSWGVFGANVPAMIRALAAIGWYGIQTYLAAAAVNAILLRFIPGTASMQGHTFLGLDALSWLSFLVLWALQLLILSRGMEVVRHVQGWSGAVIWVIMIFLGIYMLVRAHGRISFTAGGVHLTTGQQYLHVFSAMGLLMGILGTLMLNYADFTRFAPSRQAVRRGTFWGVPVNWSVFALTSVIVSAGSVAVYGKALLNPADIFARLSAPALLLVGALLLIVAAIGVNIVANFVSPAFDLSNVWPSRISFRTGGLITALIALASLPWKMYSTPVVVNYFLGALGAMIGPLFGIMIVDYFLVRRGSVVIADLYNPAPGSRYYYWRGINPNALAAFVPASALAILVAMLPAWSAAAPFAWYVGTGAAALLYYAIAARRPATVHAPSPLPVRPQMTPEGIDD